MISKAIQSLDAWLARAEEVLAEQAIYSQSQHGLDVRASEQHNRLSVAMVDPT